MCEKKVEVGRPGYSSPVVNTKVVRRKNHLATVMGEGGGVSTNWKIYLRTCALM